MVVSCRRKQTKDMLHFLLGIPLARNGGDFGEVDLVPQLGLVLVLVDREQVRAEDEVNRLP